MERFYKVNPDAARSWADLVGRPVTPLMRNSIVAIIAATRDALRAPERVMSIETGQIDRLPWSPHKGVKVPLVGAIPQPEWMDPRASIAAAALTESLYELARSGARIDAAARTAPAGAVVAFEQYDGIVAVNEGEVQEAMRPEGTDYAILEDVEVVRRAHLAMKVAGDVKTALLATLRSTGINPPAFTSAVDSVLQPTIANMAATLMQRQSRKTMLAQTALGLLAIGTAIAIDMGNAARTEATVFTRV